MWNWLRQLLGSAPQDNLAPAIGSAFVRAFNAEGYRVEVDLTTQRLNLAIPEDRAYEEGEAALAPTLAAACANVYPEEARSFVSASAFAYKTKLFDDGLYAAADLAAQQGAGRYRGKLSLLAALTNALADVDQYGEISEVIYAAARLGGINASPPAGLAAAVDRRVSEFLGDEKLSKPLGFYTWSETLKQIFQQDRMLQSVICDPQGVEPVVRALKSGTGLRAVYEEYLTFVSKLTNPLAGADLRALLAADREAPEKFSFFPASRAHETELIKKLYGTSPIPEGFNLVDEMITRIRDGRLNLEPEEDSGWYDYQTWALEPLVVPEKMPEAARLVFDESYRKHLLDLFRAIIALTRETHVKQLEMATAGAGFFREPKKIITIYPELSAEPLATYYLRRAIGYRFVRELLVEMFGAEGFGDMRRVTAAGTVDMRLGEELDQIIALCAGAHAAVQRDLGLPCDPTLQGLCKPDSAIEQFYNWAQGISNDNDLKQDVRMMVPVFYDMERRKLKVWAVLGWATRPMNIFFEQTPAVKVTDSGGRPADDQVEIRYARNTRHVAYPISAEVYVSKLMDRDEFRVHCDKYQTQSAILAALK